MLRVVHFSMQLCCSGWGPDAPIDYMDGHRRDTVGTETNPTLLQYLISIGADPLARDYDGRNVLHHMLKFNRPYGMIHHVYKSSLSYMMNKYPRLVNEADGAGRTPLHFAVLHAIAEKDAAAAEILLAAGSDPFIADKKGDTVLHLLSRRLDFADLQDPFRKLLSRGMDVNARNKKGETPLFAFYKPHADDHPSLIREHSEEDALIVFEDAGADFSACDGKGRSLLHLAAKGDASRFKTLMEKGLDVTLEDENRQTALDVAAARGNQDVLMLFQQRST
jgi:ankyrin repeat protein